MTNKFSLHKIWFFYTDEWYVPNGLAGSIGVYDSLEEAENERKRLDRIALKQLGSYDYLRDLTSFYEKAFLETQKKIVDYAKSQNWNDSLKELPFGNDSTRTYWEFSLPQNATDAQLDSILELTNASFHQIVAYKNVTEYAYVKINYDFWGKKVFDKLKAAEVLDSRTPYIAGMPNKGYYLITKPPKGRKSAKFASSENAINNAIKVFIDCVLEFPDNNFLGKTYVEEWSEQPQLLIAYLSNCKTITLVSEEITKANAKTYAAKLKKMKAYTVLTEGMNFYEVQFNSFENTKIEEIMGLIELLKLKPFQIFSQISEIDGQEVKDYVADSGTF